MQAGSRWKRFRRRLRYWLDHSERQRLLWEEMEFHIDSMVQDLVAQGMPAPEARASAHRKFGNMTQRSEEAHSIWMVRWISDFAQDLRYSFRGMRRDAGFAAFAILIAGLGIGASSTIFSVVNALLLRPLPFEDPGRVSAAGIAVNGCLLPNTAPLHTDTKGRPLTSWALGRAHCSAWLRLGCLFV